MTLERSGRWPAGVRDQYVDATKPIARMLPGTRDPGRRRDVGSHHIDVDARSFGDGGARVVEGVGAARADDERCPLRRERFGDRAPESTARSTHQRDLAAQSKIHVVLPNGRRAVNDADRNQSC